MCSLAFRKLQNGFIDKSCLNCLRSIRINLFQNKKIQLSLKQWSNQEGERRGMKGKRNRETVLVAGFGLCVVVGKKINLSLIPLVS